MQFSSGEEREVSISVSHGCVSCNSREGWTRCRNYCSRLRRLREESPRASRLSVMDTTHELLLQCAPPFSWLPTPDEEPNANPARWAIRQLYTRTTYVRSGGGEHWSVMDLLRAPPRDLEVEEAPPPLEF